MRIAIVFLISAFFFPLFVSAQSIENPHGDPISFGNNGVVQQGQSDSKTVTVRNIGSNPLSVSASVSGFGYSITGLPQSPLSPGGGSTLVQVGFTAPQDGSGTYYGLLNISLESSDSFSQQSIRLGVVVPSSGSGNTNTAPPCPEGQICNPLTSNNLTDLINKILDFIFTISLVVVPFMVIVAGFTFVTAGGNMKQVSKARDIIIWTIVGFIVILVSKGLVFVLRDILGI